MTSSSEPRLSSVWAGRIIWDNTTSGRPHAAQFRYPGSRYGEHSHDPGAPAVGNVGYQISLLLDWAGKRLTPDLVNELKHLVPAG